MFVTFWHIFSELLIWKRFCNWKVSSLAKHVGARSGYNSLRLVITADQALSVADISPGISVKMNKEMLKVERGRRKRELLKTTPWLMLNGGLSGVPSISCFKESNQVSPELKVSTGVSNPLSLPLGFLRMNPFTINGDHKFTWEKKPCTCNVLLKKSGNFPWLTEIREKHCTAATKTQIGLLRCWYLGLEIDSDYWEQHSYAHMSSKSSANCCCWGKLLLKRSRHNQPFQLYWSEPCISWWQVTHLKL